MNLVFLKKMMSMNKKTTFLNASSSEESISRVEKLRDNIFTTLTFTSDSDQSEE